MSGFFEWSRGLWLEAQLAAPPVVQRTVLPRLHQAKEIARLMMRPNLTVYQWQGQNQAGPLTVSYAGLGFAAAFLKSLLFTLEPMEEKVGQMMVWPFKKEQLNSLVSDLVIIEASKFFCQMLPSQSAFTLPLRVQHLVEVHKSWAEIQANFRESARKNDVQRIQKFGYEFELSRQPQDLRMFYQTMYVPTMGNRHGDLADISSFETLQRHFRHGFLLLIKRDGQVVSAGLCSTHHQTVLIALSGVINADHQLRREGAVAAIHYSVMRWANEAGYKVVNLGACWPFLGDGIFQSKRKWGGTVIMPMREHKRIWIRVQRETPAVTQFLKDNPAITVSPNGVLQGLILTDNPAYIMPQTRAEWNKKYTTPGLDSLLIRSVTELAGESKHHECY